jgi:hypothetical protein
MDSEEAHVSPHCMWRLPWLSNTVFMHMIWYVWATISTIIVDFRRAIMSQIEMTNLGLMRYFLGMEVKYGRNFISQEKYATDLSEFYISQCKALSYTYDSW